MPIRNLIVVLGDQLDADSSVFDGFDPAQDRVFMAEVRHEATQVWSTKARIAMFLAAMRHFAEHLKSRGFVVDYQTLGTHQHPTLEAALGDCLARLKPERVLSVRAGEWRLAQSLPQLIMAAGAYYEERPDRHFYLSCEDFERWAGRRKEYRLEYFYRFMRVREGILLEADGSPTGGQWNFDHENRKALDSAALEAIKPPLHFPPDAITATALNDVEAYFADHPGSLSGFDWPLTQAQALSALADFVAHRLVHFGRYQDAMQSHQPWLFHARISAALNLKLINPRVVIARVLEAFAAGGVALNAVEGFVRQVLGWREFVRGMYWLKMPEFLEANHLQAKHKLPAFFWHGRTKMKCLQQSLAQTLELGYAHHIQRLMVIGLFAQLYGVEPKHIHEWFLAVYVDAVEWVELPNVLGMSQYADGGTMVSKPYVASGKYIQRMSNYCAQCVFKPELATGARACPFTTLFWDFLLQHELRFAKHPRTALMWRNATRKDASERAAIRDAAAALRAQIERGEV
jgi:deoxyribodipyrimidine photolyase-related protein